MPVVQLFPWIVLLLLTMSIPQLSKKSMTLLFIIISIFSCFRYGVGWDYYNYIMVIEEGGWMIERTEYLMRQLEYFVQFVGYPQLFFIITALIINYCFFTTIDRYSQDKQLSVVLFLCLPVFFLSSLITIRFSLAVTLIFYAYRYVHKNIYIYLLFIIISLFIHKASFIAVLAIPFLYGWIRLNLQINIIVFVICFCIGGFLNMSSSFSDMATFVLTQSGFLSETFEESMNYFDRDSGGFSRSPLLYAAINICNLIWYNRLTNNNSDDESKLYITMYNLGCSVMFLFSFEATMASRLAQVFMVYLLLLCPSYNRFKIAKNVIIMIAIIAYLFQLSIHASHPDFEGRWNCFLPYRFAF